MEDRTETSMTVTPARSDTCPLTNDGAGLDEAGHAALGGYISRGSRQADGLRGPGGGARTSPPTPSTLQAGDERREHHQQPPPAQQSSGRSQMASRTKGDNRYISIHVSARSYDQQVFLDFRSSFLHIQVNRVRRHI